MVIKNKMKKFLMPNKIGIEIANPKNEFLELVRMPKYKNKKTNSN